MKVSIVKHLGCAIDEVKVVEVNHCELQECLEVFRKVGETEDWKAAESLDAAVLLDEDGCIQIYHKEGGWIRCVPFVADTGPFHG